MRAIIQLAEFSSSHCFSILPGGQPSAPPLVDFGRVEGNSRTWNANLGVGTSIFFQVRDSQGALGQSSAVSILTGSESQFPYLPVAFV